MRRWSQLMVRGAGWCSAVICFGAVFGLMGTLLIKGVPSLSTALIFGDVPPLKALLLHEQVFDGLFPAMAGTLLVVALSMCWAIPIGIGAGIYLAELGGPRVRKVFTLSLDILASVPSIVIGLFGLTTAIFLHRWLSRGIAPCLFISSIALAVLVLPYVVRTTQLALEAVPRSLRAAGMSLGASRLETLYYVVLPGSLSGILSGVILALGRAAEDTAVIMLTGVVAAAGIPTSLMARYEALPFYIYYISSQYSDQAELRSGFCAAIILIIICAVLFIVAHLIKFTVAGRFART